MAITQYQPYGLPGKKRTFSAKAAAALAAIHILSTIAVTPNHASDLGDNLLINDTLEVQKDLYAGGATNYVETKSGKVVFVGTAGLVYGEISRVSNAVETVIASQDVYVQVTIFDTNGENNNATPDHTEDHITITKAGRYFISCSITLNSIGGAGSTAEMEVKKNNGASRVGSLHVDRTLSGGGTESGAITITGIVNLAVDDTIEVWIKNETNTQNYVVEDITLSLMQIGG